MAIAAFMCCFAVKDGRHGQKKTRGVYRELGLPATTQQNAQAPGQGQTARRLPAGHQIQQDLRGRLSA
jgi:hypothetical protein